MEAKLCDRIDKQNQKKKKKVIPNPSMTSVQQLFLEAQELFSKKEGPRDKEHTNF